MWGLDVLGLAKYPELIAHWPAGQSCGVFANTFGNVWPVLKRLSAMDRCPRIRIHGVWQDDHKYNQARDLPVILKELERANELKKNWPHIDIQYSPFCEHTIKGAQLKSLINKCLQVAKDVQIVNNPWTGDLSPNCINETHGDKAGNFRNFSFDGVPCVDADVEAFKNTHKNVETFFFWTSQFNGRKNPNDPTPRPQRKAWPTRELLNSCAALSKPKGACDLPKGWIWKSHADQHDVPPEPRALKPVLISPLKVDNFKLVEAGVVISTSSSALPFEGGKYRYYFPKYGFKIAGEPVNLMAGDKVHGHVSPGFRQNDYRNK
jgi:hypothetical protein